MCSDSASQHLHTCDTTISKVGFQVTSQGSRELGAVDQFLNTLVFLLIAHWSELIIQWDSQMQGIWEMYRAHRKYLHLVWPTPNIPSHSPTLKFRN